MKNFSLFVLLLLSSSVCSPSWAMDEGNMEERQGSSYQTHIIVQTPLGVPKPADKRFKGTYRMPPGEFEFSRDDMDALFQNYVARQESLPVDPQNNPDELNLSRKNAEEWPPALKEYLQLEPYPRGWFSWAQDALHFITGLVPAHPSLVAYYVNLKTLNLSETRLTDPKPTLLLRGILTHAPQLETLNLSKTGITDEWVKSDLIKMSPICKLTKLDLSGNEINSSAPYVSMAFKSLETLNLKNNKINDYHFSELSDFLASRSSPERLLSMYLEGNPGYRASTPVCWAHK